MTGQVSSNMNKQTGSRCVSLGGSSLLNPDNLFGPPAKNKINPLKTTTGTRRRIRIDKPVTHSTNRVLKRRSDQTNESVGVPTKNQSADLKTYPEVLNKNT